MIFKENKFDHWPTKAGDAFFGAPITCPTVAFAET